MPATRNSAKALIVRDGAVLLQVCRFGEEVVHLFPGGGQEFEETLAVAVRREVLEETGLRVAVGELLWVREFVKRAHRPDDPHPGHAVEFFFRCTPEDDAPPAAISVPDDAQIGIRWVPFAELPALTVWPAAVQRHLIAWNGDGPLDTPLYLGDCL